LPKLGNHVAVSTEALSAEDYISWLCQADIVMLPYDPYVYRTHGSAIFDEAVALGIPVVAPQGCDFPRSAIEEGRAVGIVDVTVEGLVDAICAAADRIDELAGRAEAYATSRQVDTGLQDAFGRITSAAEGRLSLLDRVGKRWWRFSRGVSFRGGAGKVV
jgi:glycosyltransferase involved in cell wall biosynthesis